MRLLGENGLRQVLRYIKARFATPEQLTAAVASAKAYTDTEIANNPGPPGSPGVAATVTVGTVTTGAAGSAASVSNAGTQNAAVLNFVIPRGQDGQKGWKLLNSFTSPGAYNWIVPDILTNGNPYQIGVWAISGGGSGGYSNSGRNTEEYGRGGGSGTCNCFLLTVTPGQTIPIVVGAGGTAAEVFLTSTGSVQNSGATAGEATSFNQNSLLGGAVGGISNAPTINFAVGGAYGSTCFINSFFDPGFQPLGNNPGIYINSATASDRGGAWPSNLRWTYLGRSAPPCTPNLFDPDMPMPIGGGRRGAIGTSHPLYKNSIAPGAGGMAGRSYAGQPPTTTPTKYGTDGKDGAVFIYY